MNITGKVAIVTGGASDLGEATVRAYLDKGAKVAIFDMDTDRGNKLVEELGSDKLSFARVDVADEKSVMGAIDKVISDFGAIHICNNYAGIGPAMKTIGKKGPHTGALPKGVAG